MSEYINITPEDLSKHTDTNGICNLWFVLYDIVCPDKDESKCIEYRGKNQNESILRIEKNVNITDHESSPTWAKNIKSINIENILFQKNILINLHYIRDVILSIVNSESLGYFEVFPNFSEIHANDNAFNIFYLSENSKNNFTRCIFSDRLDTYQYVLTSSNFNTCTFKKKADFTQYSLDKVKFTNSIFEEEVSFYKATLTGCDFSLVEFHQKADFRHTVLKDNIFQYTEFREQGAFYGATFNYDPIFHNLILKDISHLYFEGLKGFIKLFSFTNTVINGRLDFSEDTIKKLDLKDSIILGTLTRRDFNPDCANWETATLLKNEEMKQNNLIRALKYKAIEKDLYMKWLKYTTVYFKWCRKCGHIVDLKSKNKIKKLYDKLYKIQQKYQIPEDTIIIDEDISLCKLRSDRLSLRLSWAFNDHGQSWLRGIFVTLGVWFVCFGMFYLPSLLIALHDKNYLMLLWSTLTSNIFFENLLDYLNPTNYESLKKYFISKTLCMRISETIGMIWFLLGKALVPYGIFEVVQAFRKYNKID